MSLVCKTNRLLQLTLIAIGLLQVANSIQDNTKRAVSGLSISIFPKAHPTNRKLTREPVDKFIEARHAFSTQDGPFGCDMGTRPSTRKLRRLNTSCLKIRPSSSTCTDLKPSTKMNNILSISSVVLKVSSVMGAISSYMSACMVLRSYIGPHRPCWPICQQAAVPLSRPLLKRRCNRAEQGRRRHTTNNTNSGMAYRP